LNDYCDLLYVQMVDCGQCVFVKDMISLTECDGTLMQCVLIKCVIPGPCLMGCVANLF